MEEQCDSKILNSKHYSFIASKICLPCESKIFSQNATRLAHKKLFEREKSDSYLFNLFSLKGAVHSETKCTIVYLKTFSHQELFGWELCRIRLLGSNSEKSKNQLIESNRWKYYWHIESDRKKKFNHHNS